MRPGFHLSLLCFAPLRVCCVSVGTFGFQKNASFSLRRSSMSKAVLRQRKRYVISVSTSIHLALVPGMLFEDSRTQPGRNGLSTLARARTHTHKQMSFVKVSRVVKTRLLQVVVNSISLASRSMVQFWYKCGASALLAHSHRRSYH